MSNLVPLPRWYYPTIVRVVLDGALYYHVAIIVCTKERPEFRADELSLVFHIEEVEDWMRSAIRHWDRALNELAKEIKKRPGTCMEHSLFITLRPRHSEISTADDTIRQAKLSA